MSLTWLCHVCGAERPDDRISVYSTQRPLGDTGVMITQNVRYCNDRSACVEGAKQVDFLRGGDDA